jgi:hypothetical protein
VTADPEDLRVLCWLLRALPNRAQGEMAAERATPAMARRVLEYMERARHDPRMRFDEPG